MNRQSQFLEIFNPSNNHTCYIPYILFISSIVIVGKEGSESYSLKLQTAMSSSMTRTIKEVEFSQVHIKGYIRNGKVTELYNLLDLQASVWSY